jgi:hypothetical protein
MAEFPLLRRDLRSYMTLPMRNRVNASHQHNPDPWLLLWTYIYNMSSWITCSPHLLNILYLNYWPIITDTYNLTKQFTNLYFANYLSLANMTGDNLQYISVLWNMSSTVIHSSYLTLFILLTETARGGGGGCAPRKKKIFLNKSHFELTNIKD